MIEEIRKIIEKLRQAAKAKHQEWTHDLDNRREANTPDPTALEQQLVSFQYSIGYLQQRYDYVRQRRALIKAYGLLDPQDDIPSRNIAIMVYSYLLSPQRGLETENGRLMHAVELTAAVIGGHEHTTTLMEDEITASHEEMIAMVERSDKAFQNEKVVGKLRECEIWDSMIGKVEEEAWALRHRQSLEIDEVDGLEDLREFAVELKLHEKHLDFDLSTALANLRDLTPRALRYQRKMESVMTDLQSAWFALGFRVAGIQRTISELGFLTGTRVSRSNTLDDIITNLTEKTTKASPPTRKQRQITEYFYMNPTIIMRGLSRSRLPEERQRTLYDWPGFVRRMVKRGGQRGTASRLRL